MTRLNDGEDLEIAQPEDFGIQFNEDEELTPVKQRIPGSEKAIRCRPLSSGDIEEYQDILEGDNADDERVAELLSEHILDGPGANATPELVEEGYPGYLVPALIQALKDSSGHDYFLATRERRQEEIAQNIDLLKDVDPEIIEQVNDLSENGRS